MAGSLGCSGATRHKQRPRDIVPDQGGRFLHPNAPAGAHERPPSLAGEATAVEKGNGLMRRLNLIVLAVALALTSALQTAHGEDLGTAFTYQGQLKEGGTPADGTYDFLFRLFDSAMDGGGGGTQVGGDVTVDGLAVTDGLFTVELDFGDTVFGGQARWLEIGVRSFGPGGPYTTLLPRQPLTAAPYAQYALNSPESAWEQGDGVISFDGDVGIGIDGPLLDLHVHEQLTGARAAGGSSLGASIVTLADLLRFVYLESNAGADHLVWDSISSLLFETESSMLHVRTEHMRITANGYVGIGTSTPWYKLHVDNGTDVEPGGGGFMAIGPVDGANLAFDGNEIMARDDEQTATLFLNNDGGDVLISANGSGNVGIGTSSPAHRLEIYANETPTALKVTQDGAGAVADFRATSTGAISAPRSRSRA